VAGACGGRTGLDTFVAATGAAGRGGSSGAAGQTGLTGVAGQPAAVGTGGAGGGAGGFGTGGFGGLPTAGMSGSAQCVDGANRCFDARTVEFCIDGVYQPLTCASGCFTGVCAECPPNTAACASQKTLMICSATGIWQPAQPCEGSCENGACVGCNEGATRCASHEGQQTCAAGQWTAAADCTFVCADDSCSMNTRHVFVTSQTFLGSDIGGLTGADDICRQLAVNAGLSSSYAAWLSDSTGSPASRFPEDAGPYVLVDGTIVANNWTDLTSGTLRHAIDMTETGGPPPATTACAGAPGAVWTDTTPQGALENVGSTCGDWADPTGAMAVWGSTSFMEKWSDGCFDVSNGGVAAPCGTERAALFCFEQ
jgi:hypothetical protein